MSLPLATKVYLRASLNQGHQATNSLKMYKGARFLIASYLLISSLLVAQIRADLDDVDQFVEEQILKLYKSAKAQGGANKFPYYIEQLSKKLNEKVHSHDEKIVSGIKSIIEEADDEDEPLPGPVNSFNSTQSMSDLSVARGPELSRMVGLTFALGKDEAANNPHIVRRRHKLSPEGIGQLKKEFDIYLHTLKPRQVILETYQLGLAGNKTASDSPGSPMTRFSNGTKAVVRVLKDVIENLTGESDDLSVPLLFLEQIPIMGLVLRKLREKHSNHISSAIRATRYAVKIANYITHRDGVLAEELKRDGIDLLKRNSRDFLKDIIESLVKVENSSSMATKQYNMLIRLTYYIFVKCLSN